MATAQADFISVIIPACLCALLGYTEVARQAQDPAPQTAVSACVDFSGTWENKNKGSEIWSISQNECEGKGYILGEESKIMHEMVFKADRNGAVGYTVMNIENCPLIIGIKISLSDELLVSKNNSAPCEFGGKMVSWSSTYSRRP